MLTHLLVAAVLLAAAHGAAAKVCPEIPRAAKHFNLRVSEYDLRLPDGRTVPQLAYNGSAVGPPLVFTLGDEVSIDVYNGLKNTSEAAASPSWRPPGLHSMDAGLCVRRLVVQKPNPA
jgi:FtsP/CotA-like multicopper oxidase with cupredoxin domain